MFARKWKQLNVAVVVFASLTASATAISADEPQPTATTNLPVPLTVTADLSTVLLGDAYAQLSANQLGIEVVLAEAPLKAQLGIEAGLVITKVPDGSEGAKAGLKAHDVIVYINGPRSEPVRDIDKFNSILTQNSGKKVEIGLLRGGKMQLVGVDVPPRQELPQSHDVSLMTVLLADHFRIGVTLAEADDTLRSQLQLPAGEGLVVTEVLADTPAEKAGMKSHDVLVELDGKRLTKVEEINKQIQEIKARAVAVKLLRGGKEESLEVTPAKVTSNQASPYENQVRIYYSQLSGANQGINYPVQWLPSTNAYLITDGAHVTLTPLGANVVVDPRGHINTLKAQLAEIQKSLIALEASLPQAQQQPQAQQPQQPPTPAAEEKK